MSTNFHNDFDRIFNFVNEPLDFATFNRIKSELSSDKKLQGSILSLDDDLPFDLSAIIPTGIIPLDAILGGGFYDGRIYEIFGKESSGKTSLMYQVCGSFQRQFGGIVIWLESENAFDKERFINMGGNKDATIIIPTDTLESGFQKIALTLSKLRNNGINNRVMIVWDTIASCPTENELNGREWGSGMMERPRLIKKHLRVLSQKLAKHRASLFLLNQVFQGDTYDGITTPGGYGIRHFTTVRLYLMRGDDILQDFNDSDFDSNDRDTIVVGNYVFMYTLKSKQSVPRQTVKVRFYFNSGYDPLTTLCDYVIDKKLINYSSNGFGKFTIGNIDYTFRGRNRLYELATNYSVYLYLSNLVFKYFSERFSTMSDKLSPYSAYLERKTLEVQRLLTEHLSSSKEVKTSEALNITTPTLSTIEPIEPLETKEVFYKDINDTETDNEP